MPVSNALGFPTFPNLKPEVGSSYALILKGFPNLPNLPNLFLRVRTRERVRRGERAPPRARVYACANTKKGWEGWEGWEEGAVERVSDSQPRKKVGKGWEEGWETRGFGAMKTKIEQMRADFERLATSRVAAGLWAKADASEAGAEIKAAIDSGDEEKVALWAEWLAEERRALASSLPTIKAAPLVPATVVPVEHTCFTCAGLARPGVYTRPGYCGLRTDLPAVYGETHPLRQLPSDQGRSCAVWQEA